MHLQAMVFTLWMVQRMGRATLVSAGRVDLHRRLDVSGTAVAAMMVIIGVVTAIGGRDAWRGFAAWLVR